MKALHKRILTLTLTSTLALTPTFNLKADPTDLFDVKAAATSLILIGGFCYYYFKQKAAPKPPADQRTAAQLKKFTVKADQVGELHITVKQNEQFKLILEKTDTVTRHYLTTDFSQGLVEMEAVGQDHPERTTYYYVAKGPGVTTCYLEKQLRGGDKHSPKIIKVTGCDVVLHIE